MKIVISPAKSLNFDKNIPTEEYSLPIFQTEMKDVNTELKKLTPNMLAKLMHISEKLADLNWQRNQEFSLPFSTKNAKQAAYVFDGDVYDGLDILSLNNNEIEKLQKTLRILSGQYGLLKPLDLIQPYRLEMGTKISIAGSKDLYDFWKDKITNALNNELSDNELFINLASNEYFKAIDVKKLKTSVVTPIFKDWKGDELKIISFYAKKARGLMVKYIIKNDVQTIDGLKGFNYEGYNFSESLSVKKGELVFVR
ncbi:peroxide stress protein YaaA [Capnocytophaga cynodegmi]|uniref:peroxide stress protein YaaA n=1 Tax=Capnocytophaga cynodegmi TaxID=28189 RepID=UPI00385BC328